jgi:hypothetical protein
VNRRKNEFSQFIHDIEVLSCCRFRPFAAKADGIIERPEYRPQFSGILAGFLQSNE